MNIIQYCENSIVKKFNNKKSFIMEKEMYEFLDGHNITPKLISVEDKILTIERYETSFDDAIIKNNIDAKICRNICDKIFTIVRKLDQIGVKHNDIAPRNIVCKNNFRDIAIIDFESAIFCDTHVRSNFDCDFYENFSHALI